MAELANVEALEELESEAIFIIREAYAELGELGLLFSGGKDSACLLHLIWKAFYPAKIPFHALLVDTGHNFPEVMEFIEETKKRYGIEIKSVKLDDLISQGIMDPIPDGESRNAQQADALRWAISQGQYKGLFGGARRDEEKARAKERLFSIRGKVGGWDPRNQRPEIWRVFNKKLSDGEHMRVFPLSNWTELDVWQYIKAEGVQIPSIYFSHQRKVMEQEDGSLLAFSEVLGNQDESQSKEMTVRCRTVGDVTCTGLVKSHASNIDMIIREVQESRISERGTRADDKLSDSAMEQRKKKGYF